MQIFIFSILLLVSLVAARDLNASGLNFIKNEELWRPCAYKDSVKLWTIGYGHKIVAGDCGISMDQCCISMEQGEQILAADVKVGSRCISRILNPSVLASLSDNEFSALVSWAFNVGCGNAGSSTLVKKLNAGNKQDTCSELRRWIYGGSPPTVQPGLPARRDRECQLFLKP